MRLATLVVALSFGSLGCYRHHVRGADAGAPDAGRTICGSAPCRLASPAMFSVEAGMLVGAVEGRATGLRGAPEVDGVRFELDPCDATGLVPCPQTITVSGVGADLADPAVLGGAVEVSIDPRAIVIHGDPCPGCDDGHLTAQLYFAAFARPLGDADLPLGDVRLAPVERCATFGHFGEPSARFAWTVSATSRPDLEVTVDEGETRPVPASEYVLRVVRSSYECRTPDLPPPAADEVSALVVYSTAGS